MSSSALPQSANVFMLRELLAAEKEITRVWLRAEMDRLVDPLLDTLFYRLETKLANGLERTQSDGHGNNGAQMSNQTFVYQSANVPESATFIGQPSTSVTSSLNPPLSYFHPHHVNTNYSQPIPFDPRFRCQSSLPNELANVQSRPMPIKHEIEATANEPMTEGRHLPEYLFAPIVNEQSNDNLANWDEEDDEEECDCDECVYGIKVDDEDDDSDGVQWIEHDHELSRPAKIPRIDPTQPNNAQAEVIDQSPRQPTGEAQPNQMNKRIITVHLQCPQSNCFDTFPEEQLNRHMMDKHFLGPNRCLVKDCGQSFDNKRILSDHIKRAHQQTAQWHCGKCVKHFAEYKLLYRHNVDYHQLGHFKCSFPLCAFTGEYRKKVYNHYRQQHEPDLVCPQSGCNYRTKDSTHFKAHKRSHLGTKPYHCKWPNCLYSSTSQNTTMAHIKRTHFKSSSSADLTHLGKPNDYIEFVP